MRMRRFCTYRCVYLFIITKLWYLKGGKKEGGEIVIIIIITDFYFLILGEFYYDAGELDYM